MALPLKVRIVRHALQQNVVPLLDLTDRHVSGAGLDEPKVLTRALAAVAIWEQAGCELDEAAAAIVDGEGDGGIDAIHVSINPPRIYVVQSKWRNPGNATLDSAAVNKFREGFDDLTNGNIEHLNDRIKAIWPRFRQVQMDHEHKTIVIAALLGDDPVHPDQRRGLDRIAKDHGEEFFEFRNMHLADFSRITKNGISRSVPELTVSLIESFRREARRDRDGKVVRQEAYSGTVLAKDVFGWVGTYGERLFDQNIRGSLGSTSVNEKIRTTLQNTPELFWTLNKGITLVADSIKRSAADSGHYNAPAHLTMPGASIVDGAQTASSVYKVISSLGGAGLPGDAEIPIKIISLEGAPRDLTKRITFAANTQNAILQRDFASADEAQEELQLLDQLGKRYVYKRNENLAIASDTLCLIEEVALALTCLRSDARLVGRVRKNEDALWDQAAGGIYQALFHPVPDARLAWDGVPARRPRRSRGRGGAADGASARFRAER